MRIDITNLTEADVTRATAVLDDLGYRYDVDYTTLYGAGWAIVGLSCRDGGAAVIVIQLIDAPAVV